MKKPRHGIPKENRERTKYKRRDPAYPEAGPVNRALKDWGDAWKVWIEDLGGELKTAIKQYPEKGEMAFNQAKDLWNVFGKRVQQGGCQLLDGLNGLYPPDPTSTRKIITDATKPPPPPFGGGRDDDQDCDTDE
jgi:hypothetical protein